jgi:HEAT repeat protein
LAGYPFSPVPGADEFEILPFDMGQVQAAARAWFGARNDFRGRFWNWAWSRGEFPQVLYSPLLLRLACQTFDEGEAAPPDLVRRADLFHTFIEHTVNRWENRVGRQVAERRGRFISLAAAVALRLWQPDGRRSTWDEETVHAAVTTALAEQRVAYAGSLYADLRDSGLLVPVGPDQYGTPLSFAHRTLGEYLVATAVASRPDWAGTVRQHACQPGWEEVLTLIAGVLERQDEKGEEPCGTRAAELIGYLLREVQSDLLARPLPLAVRAAADVRRLNAVTVDRLVRALTDLLIRPFEFLAPENMLTPDGLDSAPAVIAAIGGLQIVPTEFLNLKPLAPALATMRPRVEQYLIDQLRVPPQPQPTPGLDALYTGIPTLTSFIRHPDYLFAQRLPYLAHFGDPGKEEIWNILLGALRQPHLYTLATALEAIGILGDAGPVNGAVLNEMHKLIRQPPEFIKEVIQPLSWLSEESKGSEDPWHLREQILSTAARFQKLPDDLIEELRNLAHQGAGTLTESIARTLAGRASSDPLALKQLETDLNDPQEQIRMLAAENLPEVGPLSPEAVTRLTEMVRTDPGVWCRANAAAALAKLPQLTSTQFDVLRSACQDPAPEVRRAAAGSLIQLTRGGSAAKEVLRFALEQADPEVQRQALYRLRAEDLEGEPGLVRRLIETTGKSPREWGHRFSELSPYLVNEAPEILDDVCAEAKRSSDPSSRRTAAEALGQIRPVSEQSLDALWWCLGDPFWSVREAAVDGLIRLNRQGLSEVRTVVEKARDAGHEWAGGLRAFLGHELVDWAPRLGADVQPNQRLLTAELVLAFGHEHKAGVAIAEEELAASEPQDESRWRWAKLLGQLARTRPHLLTPLVRAMSHPDKSVQENATATVITLITASGVPLSPDLAPPQLREVHRRLLEVLRPVTETLCS